MSGANPQEPGFEPLAKERPHSKLDGVQSGKESSGTMAARTITASMSNLRAWRVAAGYETAEATHKAFSARTRRVKLSLASYRMAESGRYELREDTARILAQLFGARDSIRLLSTRPGERVGESIPKTGAELRQGRRR